MILRAAPRPYHPSRPSRPATGGLISRRVLGVLAAGLLSVAGCTQQTVPVATTHESSWIDAAIASVSTQSGYQPVIEVSLNPTTATIVTRQPDTRVQHVWTASIASPTPQPKSTVSPSETASVTPVPVRVTTTASASTSGSASVKPSVGVTVTPSLPAASVAPAQKVDNSYGNMSLGAFGDTQIRPMWLKLQALGCTNDGWTITARAGWSGTVVTWGNCRGSQVAMVNGEALPIIAQSASPSPTPVPKASASELAQDAANELLGDQLGVLASLTSNQLARITVHYSNDKACPTSLTADYRVTLGGELTLRTNLNCAIVTTQTLTNGSLPEQKLGPDQISPQTLASVRQQLQGVKKPIDASNMVVEWNAQHNQYVISPAVNPKVMYGFDAKQIRS